MLIQNYVLDLCLLYGLVGCVESIVCRSLTVPQVSSAFLDYGVVNFPKCLIRDDHNFFPDKPYTWESIPMDRFQCGNYCCPSSTISLREFKAITINK